MRVVVYQMHVKDCYVFEIPKAVMFEMKTTATVRYTPQECIIISFIRFMNAIDLLSKPVAHYEKVSKEIIFLLCLQFVQSWESLNVNLL